MANDRDELSHLVQQYSDREDTDIIAYIGDISRPYDDHLIRECRTRELRRNVLLILATFGGDAHAAYRIARCLQRFYQTTGGRTNQPTNNKFSVFLPSVCKSAGTILTLGADAVIMSDMAEMGPIDVQLRKPDEVGERTSGLTPIQALESLERQSKALFREHFEQLRFDQDLAFSTKMAADIATSLTVGLMSPMYGQIDSMRLAEIERSLRISEDYGERLAVSNLKPRALQRLLGEYPSHGFVIDREEAKDLFKSVAAPDDSLKKIERLIHLVINHSLINDEPFVFYLSEEPADCYDGMVEANIDGAGRQEK